MTRMAATIGLVLSVLVLAWAAWSWWSPPAPSGPVSPAVSSPASGPGATEPPSSSGAPGASPSARNATPSAAPRTPSATRVTRVEIPSAAYTAQGRTMAVADTGVINPPDFQSMWWIRDRGVIPNSAPTDTAYLACHTNAAKAASVVPCNQITLDNARPGATIRVTTDTEELTYTITRARQVPRDEFASDREVWDINPGRLVVVSCYLSEGRRTDYNLVLIAELDR